MSKCQPIHKSTEFWQNIDSTRTKTVHILNEAAGFGTQISYGWGVAPQKTYRPVSDQPRETTKGLKRGVGEDQIFKRMPTVRKMIHLWPEDKWDSTGHFLLSFNTATLAEKPFMETFWMWTDKLLKQLVVNGNNEVIFSSNFGLEATVHLCPAMVSASTTRFRGYWSLCTSERSVPMAHYPRQRLKREAAIIVLKTKMKKIWRISQ